MRSNMWKSTLREIKQSFGRFMAIFAIVALGVSLFSGLKVLEPAMVTTTNAYLQEKQFYNYRLLSTLGFEQEDVEFLKGKKDVRQIEGAVTFDILCSLEQGSNMVLKAYNLPENINAIELLSGRLPENSQECVVDSAVFSEETIGKKIVLSVDNEEDDLENFVHRAYTIVGIAQSPNYIQFERGNTSLGNGKITGFMYLPDDAFDVDYFTEILVKFDEDFLIYTDAYKNYMDAKEDEWEVFTEEAANLRYERIVAEAEEELLDAKKEFEEEKAEAENELEDARIELADAKKELNKAQKELADAKQKIEDGKQELADGREELSKNIIELQRAEKDIAKGEEEFVNGQQEITQNREVLKTQEAQLAEGMAQLNAGQAQLDAYKAQIPEGMELPQQIVDAQAQLDGQRAQLQEAEKQLEAGKAQLDEAQKQLDSAKAELEAGKARIDAGWDAIEDAQKDMAEAEQELADGEAEILDGEKELADGWVEFYDGQAEYDEGYAEFLTEIADAEAEIADAEKEIADIEKPETYVLGRETNIGYACFENDSAIVNAIANVFPVFFFAVAALVCVTTMNRMVEEQRTQIGVLKALGYSQSSIMGKYLFYSGAAAISGCIAGYFFGIWFFPLVIWYAYGSMYDVDSIIYVFDAGIFICSLLVSMTCSMGTTYLSCRKELSEVAAELMRPKAPKAGKRVFLERIPFVWKRMKFLHKVSYRNVFRYKKRFFMMVIGISGCTALVLTGFGVQDSIANIANDQYDRIQIYDVNVMLSEDVEESTDDLIARIAGERATEYLYVMEKTMDLTTEDAIKGVNLIAIDESADISPYIFLPDAEGNRLEYPKQGECILTDKLANMYELQVGDVITLTDENNHAMEVTLSGIAENYLYNFVYMTIQSYETALGENAEIKSIYLNVAEGIDAYQLTADLMKEEEVTSATVSADSKNRFTSMIESLGLMVVVIILCAAFLAFIVLYNLTNINITERVREIATIKVLGFYRNETASYIFRENLILTFIGAMAGLFLGKLFHGFVMSQVQVDQVSFAVRILPMSYLYSVLMTFVFAFAVNWFMRRKLDRVSMTESLKSVD